MLTTPQAFTRVLTSPFWTISWRKKSVVAAVGALVLLACPNIRAGWTKLKNQPKDAAGNLVPIQTMLLMSDGTVMAHDGSTTAWYKLTPASDGTYSEGSWAIAAAMGSTRRFFTSVVLTDSRMLVAGAEYGTGWNTFEIYNSVNNSWTNATAVGPTLITQNNNPMPPNNNNNAGFSDSVGMILPNGNVLVGPVYPVTGNGTVIYDVASNNWVAGPAARASQNEVSWLKLADDSILTIDKSGTTAERYMPATNTWVADDNPPAGNLYSGIGSEVGAGLLLPDGRGFFIGATGKTAIYSPSAAVGQRWVQGPDVPNDPSGNAQGGVDAPAAMMVNGKILCAVSRAPFVDGTGTSQVFNSPTRFYEYSYDPNGGIGSFSAELATPTGSTESAKCFQTNMLDLPDGTVLYSNSSSQLYVYKPDGSPLAAGAPTITGIVANADGSYHLTGTQLNGISAGAAYGDDAQMDSNYPLVRAVGSGPNVQFARTYNWSSTGVRTGNNPVSTEFVLPNDFVNGGVGGPSLFSLDVIANGNHSAPVDFGGPVWVDFNYTGTERGSSIAPYRTLNGAVNAAVFQPQTGRTIRIKGPASTSERISISIPVTIVANGGPVTIGR